MVTLRTAVPGARPTPMVHPILMALHPGEPTAPLRAAMVAMEPAELRGAGPVAAAAAMRQPLQPRVTVGMEEPEGLASTLAIHPAFTSTTPARSWVAAAAPPEERVG